MDAAAADPQLPPFYVTSLSLNDGQLTVHLGDKSGPIGQLVIDTPESFWVFQESDHYELLATYIGPAVLITSDKSIGVFRLARSRLLEIYTHNGRSKGEAQAYLIATAQEHVEIVCFDPPVFKKG